MQRRIVEDARKRSGFTRGEALLLGGVASLGCVVALGLVWRASRSATTGLELERLRETGAGLVAYAADHDGAFPPVGNLVSQGGDGERATQLLRLYVDAADLFLEASSVAGEDVVGGDVRHAWTSFRIDPVGLRLYDGQEGHALVAEAAGIGGRDTDLELAEAGEAWHVLGRDSVRWLNPGLSVREEPLETFVQE